MTTGRSRAARASRERDRARIAELRARGMGLTSLSPRAQRWSMLIGIAGAAAGVATYAWLVAVALLDRPYYLEMAHEMHTYSGEYGSTEASNVASIAGPSVVVFLVGCLLIALSEISRRGSRPLARSTLAVLAAALVTLWALSAPAQLVTGVLPGDPGFDGARSLLVVPAVIFAGGAAVVSQFLILRVKTGSAGRISRPSTMGRSLVQRWRVEVVAAAAGGASLGASVFPAAQSATATAVVLLVLGGCLYAAGLLLAFRVIADVR